MQLFEFARDVVSFSEQPDSLRIHVASRWRQYTPDMVVHWHDGREWLVEVKPRELADEPAMRERLAAAREAAALLGRSFVVITDRHVDRPGIAAVRELLTIAHQVRVGGLGEGPGIFGLTGKLGRPDLPASLKPVLANGRRLRVLSLLKLLGATPDPWQELRALLAARLLAWPLHQRLCDTTLIHRFTEKDDEDLFV